MAVLGANSPEWFSCAVGAVMAGGVVSFCNLDHCHFDHDDVQVTGVYTTNTTEAVHYQLKHSMANIAVVDGKAQLEKVTIIIMMVMTRVTAMTTIIIMIIMIQIHEDDDDDYHDHGNLVDGDVTQVLAVRDKLPDLRAIVQYGEEEVDHEGVIGWEDFQVSCCLWLRC